MKYDDTEFVVLEDRTKEQGKTLGLICLLVAFPSTFQVQRNGKEYKIVQDTVAFWTVKSNGIQVGDKIKASFYIVPRTLSNGTTINRLILV